MNILILEDEKLAAEALASMLQKVNDASIVGSIPSIKAGLKWFEENAMPDLILSDIQLQDGVSFELFKQLNIQCPIIFITAYDHYAIKAFEVNSMDYLLKPIDQDDLNQAIEKFRKRTSAAPETNQFQRLIDIIDEGKKNYKSRFLIKVGQKIKAVSVDRIAYFYSQHKLTYLVTYDGDKLPTDLTLEALEEQVDPNRFYRANRQFMVGFDSIDTLHPYFKGRLKVELNPPSELEIVVSADKTREFKAWLDQ